MGGGFFFDGEGALDEILEEAIEAPTIAFAKLLTSIKLLSRGELCGLDGASRGEFRWSLGMGTGKVALGLPLDACKSLVEPLCWRGWGPDAGIVTGAASGSGRASSDEWISGTGLAGGLSLRGRGGVLCGDSSKEDTWARL